MKLKDCILNSAIEFYDSKLDKLDSKLEDFGEYNWNLVTHLASQSNEVVIKGDGIYDFLSESENVSELSEFIIQLWSKSVGGRYYVDANIETSNDNIPFQMLYLGNPFNIENMVVDYSKKTLLERNSSIVNPKDVTFWLSSLNYFERVWNFSLCSAIAGFVGYPGYEWPQNEDQLKEVVAENAQYFMIGSNGELNRYTQYLGVDQEIDSNISHMLDLFIKKD